MVELLDSVQQKMRITETPFSNSPKISKGENYLGLPYVILDYPREFSNNNLLFIRSMFWWGNFFSSTLQISGDYRKVYLNRLQQSFSELAQRNYYIAVGADPWAHHFEQSNFRPIAHVSETEYLQILNNREHIKIAAKWPLEQWDSAASLLYESWIFLLALISQSVE